jgi:hypothetical protein
MLYLHRPAKFSLNNGTNVLLGIACGQFRQSARQWFRHGIFRLAERLLHAVKLCQQVLRFCVVAPYEKESEVA